MIATIGTAGTRYRVTSRVWTPAAVTIEAAHITITMPARVDEPGAWAPHNGDRPKQDGDHEGDGQCPEQIGGEARKIGPWADPNRCALQIDRLNRPAVPRQDVGHMRHVVDRHRYDRVQSVDRPCDRGAIGHLTDELARIGQRPVTQRGQEDALIGRGRGISVSDAAGDIAIQRGVEQACVAEEAEHAPVIRLRGEIGGKLRHHGVGAVAGCGGDLAPGCIACQHDVEVIAEQGLGTNTTEAWSESEAANREPAASSASAAATDTAITARRAGVSGQARRAPTTMAAIGTRIPCDLKHAASAAHSTAAATA